jgi:hypothetical protein
MSVDWIQLENFLGVMGCSVSMRGGTIGKESINGDGVVCADEDIATLLRV